MCLCVVSTYPNESESGLHVVEGEVDNEKNLKLTSGKGKKGCHSYASFATDGGDGGPSATSVRACFRNDPYKQGCPNPRTKEGKKFNLRRVLRGSKGAINGRLICRPKSRKSTG